MKQDTQRHLKHCNLEIIIPWDKYSILNTKTVLRLTLGGFLLRIFSVAPQFTCAHSVNSIAIKLAFICLMLLFRGVSMWKGGYSFCKKF